LSEGFEVSPVQICTLSPQSHRIVDSVLLRGNHRYFGQRIRQNTPEFILLVEQNLLGRPAIVLCGSRRGTG
jgi:hypothetical protein